MKKKDILDTFSKIGIAQPVIRLYDQVLGLQSDDDSFGLHNVPEISVSITSDDSKGIILFPYAHSGPHDAYLYSIIASSFAHHGFRPIFILHDGILPITCNSDPCDVENNSPYELHKYTTLEILDQFGHESYYMSDFTPDYLSSLDRTSEIKKEYNNIDLDRYAKASTRKLLKKYHFGPTDREIYEKFLLSGRILAEVYKRIISEFGPLCMIAHDDKYNQGGIPLNVANSAGVHSYSLTFGWTDRSLVLSNVDHRSSFPHYECSNLINNILSRPLSTDIIDGTRDIMESRRDIDGKSRVQYSSISDQSINPRSESINVGMFTNLIWDASLEVQDCPYPDVFDWISDTIESLVDNENIDLYVKTHPAENLLGTNESVYEWIMANHRDKIDKFELLKPDTDVNTYEMISDLNVGIVYNSTVGLEMMYYNKPVITAGDTHYRGFEMSFDPITPEEYMRYLNNLDSISITEDRVKRVIKYIHYLFKGKHLDFKYISHKKGSELELKPITTKEIIDNKVLNQIVKKCSQGKPVLSSEYDWVIDDMLFQKY